MNTLNQELRDRAVACGLCTQWQGEWLESKSEQQLIDMYKRGLDFCISNNYPTNEFIKQRFNHELRLMNLVFVDEPVDVTGGANGVYVLNGKCSGQFRFGRYAAGTLHVRHDCELEIVAEDCARLFISVYDNAKVTVRQSDAAKVFVYRKSDDAVIETSGDVKVRRKVAEKESGA